MSLIQLSDCVYAFDLGATLVGVLMNEDSATLIDSGTTKQHGKMLEKAINKPIVSIVHTHYHHDHIGGTPYLQQKYNAKAFMPEVEKVLLQAGLGQDIMYGGPAPSFMSKPKENGFNVTWMSTPETVFVENGFSITPVAAYGHSLRHTAYLADDILFLGDALSSPSLMEKYKLLYLYDAAAAYDAFDRLRSLDFARAVVCHKGIISKGELIEQSDIQKHHIEERAHAILCLINGQTLDELTAAFIAQFGLPLSSADAWSLTTSTLRGYLTKLEKDGLVVIDVKDGRMLWQKA